MAFGKFNEWFDPRLVKYVDQWTARTRELTGDPFLHQLLSQVPFLLHDGKRVRPYICSLAYRIAGRKKIEDIQDVLMALELFHTFCLIHDDVIDLGETRRGVATIHALASRKMEEDQRRGDIDHIAHGQAILVGDLVFSWAEELLFRQVHADQSAWPAILEFRKMVEEVVIGQMVDVDIMTRASIEEERLTEKMLLKTASYTFIRPMRIGFALAGASDVFAEFADRFGAAIGMAFQIQDDLLDLTATEDQFKKTVLSDIQDGQHTLFTQYIFEQGSEKDRDKLSGLFGRRLNEEEAEVARDLFIKSGAIEYGTAEMNRQFRLAEEIVQEFLNESPEKNDLLGLVQKIRTRTS